ncbi:Ferric enterobactin transport system permease protein fepG [Tatumella ptyseos]|uniref:Ferric enterobactin transport system permease protein fepG n=1 Tax=Tatumella ptyseos TaxID=82987 RepID=A0A2X5S923_9GAMM|nr:Ferric enterobactin transport system permease protein fepG [Tatumella ptyseos]
MNRQLTGGLLLIAVLVTVSFLALTQGTFTLSAGQFGQVLLGKAPKAMTMVVLDWRLPRVCAAMVTGAALALSGAIFQSLLRNPLGSPDVLGFNTGAFSAVLLMMVSCRGNPHYWRWQHWPEGYSPR